MRTCRLCTAERPWLRNENVLGTSCNMELRESERIPGVTSMRLAGLSTFSGVTSLRVSAPQLAAEKHLLL